MYNYLLTNIVLIMMFYNLSHSLFRAMASYYFYDTKPCLCYLHYDCNGNKTFFLNLPSLLSNLSKFMEPLFRVKLMKLMLQEG